MTLLVTACRGGPDIDVSEAPGKTAVDQDQTPRSAASLCLLTLPALRCPLAA